jgi:hypothetical protein
VVSSIPEGMSGGRGYDNASDLRKLGLEVFLC